MNKLNKETISHNIAEALEELQYIIAQLSSSKQFSEIKLQIGLEHAYHHLNFAWNARRISNKKYKNITDAEFNRYGNFPKDIELPKLSLAKKKIKSADKKEKQ